MRCKLKDVIYVNPREKLPKGTIAKKVAMDKLLPFTRDIPSFEFECYSGGAKFRNGDTIMARITPCLENGKTAKVTILGENEIGFGSTEFIVFRAVPGITDPDYVYYLVCSPLVRDPAIKSMVGTSGRQRVQTDVVASIELDLPPIDEQQRIGKLMRLIDDKIEINRKINDNLQQQAFCIFDSLMQSSGDSTVPLSEIAELNPKRDLLKNTPARYIDMARLSTTGSFPDGWEVKPYNGGMRFRNGDTLLARITPCLENGKTAFIDFLEGGEVAFGSTEYVVMCPRYYLPPEFFYCLARYPSFIDYAVKNMNGSSGRQRVSAETIGKYEVSSLSSDDFDMFSSVVPNMFKTIRSRAFENIKLASLRDALLPRLMSGEIDVSSIKL